MNAEPLLPPELMDDAPPITDDDLAAWAAFDDADDDVAGALADAHDRVAGFRIEDDAAAEWAMRKLRVADAELAVLHDQLTAYLAPITRWTERVTKVPLRTRSRMEALLEDYAVRRREAGGAATLTLPSGVVKTTTSQPCAEVEDDRAAAEWLDLCLTPPPPGVPDEQMAGWRAWRAAWDALVAKATEPVVLVKREPKVYVGPFRKLATLGEQVVGTEVTTVLSCGHLIVHTTNELDATEGDYGVGEAVECVACPADPIDGPARVAVAAVEFAPVVEPTVFGPDGEPIPGTVVKPGSITPKVVPGG